MRRRVCGAVSITGALDMICDGPSTLVPERLTLVCLCEVRAYTLKVEMECGIFVTK